MRKFWKSGILLCVLLLIALVIAGCEKDRPVPTPKGTPSSARSTGVVPGTPEPGVTQVNLGKPTSSQGESLATPVPLEGADSAEPASQPQATVNATKAPSSSASGEYFAYKVQVGDTLGTIAKRFGVTTEAIIALNTLKNPDVLMIGQELKIPGRAPSGQAAGTQAGTTGGTTVYVVRSGDTLGSIARRFGVSVTTLATLNGIANPDQIKVGQRLQIPAASSTAPATPSRTYVVRRGDTLFSIAVRHGVTVAALQAANSLSDADKIYPGQVLKIP